MKHLLVPTDFSEMAKNAESLAFEIAKKNNAGLDFLNMVNVPKYLKISATANDDLPEEIHLVLGSARNDLDKLEYKGNRLSVLTKGYLSETESIDIVLNHIVKQDIDLVIMGSHGSSGFREAIVGSNAQKLIRLAKVPVLILKNKIEFQDIKNIVFVSTFKEDVHSVFEKVIEFSSIFNAHLHLLYVNLPYSFEESHISLNRMKEFVKKYPSKNFKFHIFNAFDEESGIHNFAVENKMDLIAMSTHGKSGFMQMLSPSITESLVNHSNLPVLSVNLKHK